MARNKRGPKAPEGDGQSLLSPVAYDDDASSLHSRSDQDSDSEDDQLQRRARNSRELRAHDRIVLMEEEEMDRLVTSSRREQRRGSGLTVPNPLRMFGRNASPSSLPTEEADLVSEKRQTRRSRRKQRRNKMMRDAREGEDGELMYEMEEGGMLRHGSSTGESTPRADSAEVDRHHLGLMANATAQRGRGCRRFVFLHLLILTGFAILVLLAWKLSKGHARPGSNNQSLVSNGTALFAPTTIILSLDGFRADFLQRGLTPRLNAFIKEGVSPAYMRPSFPSVTFPNHYTLATGLYPESHGVVGNSFWDPELQAEFYYTDPARSLDAKWWGGEPFWVTAELQGIRTAVHMWPGSEAHIRHVEPSFVDKYNGAEKLPKKVARMLEFLDLPGKEDESVDVRQMRPQLIAAYVPNVDADGHIFGPNSTETRSTIQEVDKMLDELFHGLEQRNLTGIVNVVVVSDHGMATTDTSRLMQLEDLVDVSKIEHTDGWPLYGLRPKNDDDLQALHSEVKEKTKSNPNVDVYLRDVDMPERYHFSNNQRIAPLWIVPKPGWAIVKKDEFNVEQGKKQGLVYHPRGLHGYDHEHPLMRAIFVARGPAFPHPANSRLEPFQNIEVYNILADSVGMDPKPNNGTLRLPLKPVGKHDEQETEAEPADPPPPEPSQVVPQRPTLAQGPVQPDKSTAPKRPTLPKKPDGDTEKTDSDAAEEDEESTSGSIKDRIKGALDWLADSISHMWKKVRGGHWKGS
ncbi:hypothetical protein XA68_13881 [Ophiocordyceps unilateralis]|uniref:Extracellular Endonuclease subunit A domain-containing protein n=1 Tax=Ophiocordyceps unilateralis TaxID=268505 RepID=A0A2A9PBL4_OPHUN|nr:hypothetical protein XA68_13881 [Ophiocordyceps unilateralis]